MQSADGCRGERPFSLLVVSSSVEKLVMNPIMWMSQYNPERLEDATSFYGQSAVLSVMDDMSHQPTMVSILFKSST